MPMTPVPGVKMDWIGQRWDEHRARRADERLLLWNWLSLQYRLADSGRNVTPAVGTTGAAARDAMNP